MHNLIGGGEERVPWSQDKAPPKEQYFKQPVDLAGHRGVGARGIIALLSWGYPSPQLLSPPNWRRDKTEAEEEGCRVLSC